MSALSAANTNAFTDKLVADWNAMLGTAGSGYGLGDGTFGASKKQGDLATIVAALNDVVLESIAAPIAQYYPSFTAKQIFLQQHAALLAVLNGLGAASSSLAASVVDWDSLLAYYNTGAGGPWGALAAPDYLAAMQALKITPKPTNIYLEVLQGASWQGTTFTNALRKISIVASVPTQTPGYTVDPTAFAGGFPFLNVISITGSDVVTVTGKNQNNTTESYTVTPVGTGRVALVPGTTSTDLIGAASNIVAGPGITAMVAYVEANRPSGRTNPPT